MMRTRSALETQTDYNVSGVETHFSCGYVDSAPQLEFNMNANSTTDQFPYISRVEFISTWKRGWKVRLSAMRSFIRGMARACVCSWVWGCAWDFIDFGATLCWFNVSCPGRVVKPEVLKYQFYILCHCWEMRGMKSREGMRALPISKLCCGLQRGYGFDIRIRKYSNIQTSAWAGAPGAENFFSP